MQAAARDRRLSPDSGWQMPPVMTRGEEVAAETMSPALRDNLEAIRRMIEASGRYRVHIVVPSDLPPDFDLRDPFHMPSQSTGDQI